MASERPTRKGRPADDGRSSDPIPAKGDAGAAKGGAGRDDTLFNMIRNRIVSRPRVPGEPIVDGRPLRAVPSPESAPAGPEPGDYTKLILRRRNRRMVTVAGTVVGLAIFATLFLIPLRSWMRQREQITVRDREAASLEAANRQLEAENAQLQTEEGLKEAAGEINLGEPGAESIGVIVEPLTLANMPDGWPYSIVRGIVNARITAAAPPVTAAPATAPPTTASAPVVPTSSP